MPEHYVSNLDEDARTKSINLLKPALAAAIDLQLAVKQAHWTIKGPSFIGLHELLDQVATRAYGHSDMIAERMVILGAQTHGTTQKVAENTKARCKISRNKTLAFCLFPVSVSGESRFSD